MTCVTGDETPLSPAEHFRFARDTLAALRTQVGLGERHALVRAFGIDVSTGFGADWLNSFVAVDQQKLLDLANYLENESRVFEEPSELIEEDFVDDEGDEAETTDDEFVDQIDPSAATIDAYAELVSAETALRDVIRTAVPLWQNDYTSDDIANLEAKRVEEDKRRDGIAVSQDLLDYTEIYELQKIINKHWGSGVQAVLDDKKRTDVYLGVILDVRNSIGHSRPVYASERLLLAGAAGQIRNQLARYRASADGPVRHYPSLNSARDSMGNEEPSNPSFMGRGSGYFGPPPPPTPRLEVGDAVTFELEATDPRGRDLIWRAHIIPSNTSAAVFASSPVVGEATGDRVAITWTIGEDDVGENRQIAIILANVGRYHRHGSFDDACAFTYHVNPPPDA